ncbi:MAG: ribosomal-processing cysteine protease Prp [Candidatus Eremiobacteraeota bacterium]|nr:ribosomal-processing cysteine protease Prp [Candidatus Eremiobacteraeota bacterium]
MTIEVILDTKRNVTAFHVRGHAQPPFEESEDMACAAVSALLQTAVIALKKLTGGGKFYFKRKGCLSLMLPCALEGEACGKALFLLDSVYLGIREIARAYPEYIYLEEVLEEARKNTVSRGKKPHTQISMRRRMSNG